MNSLMMFTCSSVTVSAIVFLSFFLIRKLSCLLSPSYDLKTSLTIIRMLLRWSYNCTDNHTILLTVTLVLLHSYDLPKKKRLRNGTPRPGEGDVFGDSPLTRSCFTQLWLKRKKCHERLLFKTLGDLERFISVLEVNSQMDVSLMEISND